MKQIITGKEIRQNSDIKKLVIHHSENTTILSGKDYNKEFSVLYPLGVPYDIIINFDGKIDLSPQWIYGTDISQYKIDVGTRNLVPTNLHHYAKIGTNEVEKKEMCHICIIGDFNNNFPLPIQIGSLYQVLEKLCKKLQLCIINSLVYYSELHFTSSPGVFFPEKQTIIQELISKNSLEKLCFPTQPS